MKFYIEAWSAKQAWLDLSVEERGAYMEQVGPAIQDILDQGVEILAWSANDGDTFERLNHNYFAVWKFPTDELAKSFEALVSAAGWYNYFDQVNLKGSPASPTDIIGQMINL